MDSINETSKQVYALIGEALDLDKGDESISLLEEAVRLADTCGDLELQYFAREELVRACIFGGATDKALVAFSWCLAQFDKNPGKFSEWAILWKYKWIVGLICNFPRVSKAKIYEMLDDMTERFQRAGYSLRAVYNHRYRTEKFWGNKEKAIEYYLKMLELPQDDVSNCSSCELDERSSFAIYCGYDELGVELALPLLDGSEKCATVPHRTYANLLMPLIRLGRQKEALLYHRKGYSMIYDNKAFLDRMGDHIIFLALTENFKRAINLVEKHYPWTEKNRDVLDRFRFFRAAWLLFELLAEQDENSIKLSLPQSFPLYSEEGLYNTTRLAVWFKQRAFDLASRFDERNETDFFAQTLSETPALKELKASFPLREAEL
jgi:tetratricopeptide (TPR) repeat protein